MSMCLIITQGEKMFIGADSACSVKTNEGFKRCSDDIQKLFCIGKQIFFCSGNIDNVYECVNWIYTNFTHSISIDQLKDHLVKHYNELLDEYYNIELLIVDYATKTVYQLSQYNNFDVIVHPYSNQTRIICGGYKTSEAFLLAKKNILMKKSIYDVYFDTYSNMIDECLGGYLYLYSSPVGFSKNRLIEKNIKYVDVGDCHLLTSDFVTAGFVNGSQIIGGEIYSQNYEPSQNNKLGTGTMFDLNLGSFSLAGGRIVYDGNNNLTFKNVTLDWNSTSSPELEKQLQEIDTLAKEALGQANQGIADAATGISLANKAQGSADNAQDTANKAQTRAENAETNAKDYADEKDKTVIANANDYTNVSCSNLSTALTNAYETYTDSKVSELDEQVASYLGLGGSTLIGSNYIISPYIAGGYLNITNTSNNSRVIIDPNNLTGNNTIFQIHNGNKVVIGLTNEGSALFDGTLYAQSGKIGGFEITETSLGTFDNGFISIHQSGDWALRVGTHVKAEDEYGNPISISALVDGAISTITYPKDQYKLCVGHEGNIYTEGVIAKGVTVFDRTGVDWGAINLYHKDGVCFSSIWNDEWGLAFRSNNGEINFYNSLEIPEGKHNRCNFDLPVYMRSALYDVDGGIIVASDENLKNSISYLDVDESADFIYSLRSAKFKYNNGTSDRYHHGLIAQDVKRSMGTKDWGLYVETEYDNKIMTGLRYEELIADLIATVQSLNERVKELENKI